MAAAAVRHAPIAWAQRNDLVYLTIELDSSVKIDELSITPTSFKFKGTTKECAYETSFDFFEEIDAKDIKKTDGSRYTELALTKKSSNWWPRLLKEKLKAHWLKVDFGKWKDEDESDAEDPAGGMNFNNFDLSQYANQFGGGEAPDLGDFEDGDDDDEMPDLEDAEEEGKDNGETKA